MRNSLNRVRTRVFSRGSQPPFRVASQFGEEFQNFPIENWHTLPFSQFLIFLIQLFPKTKINSSNSSIWHKCINNKIHMSIICQCFFVCYYFLSYMALLLYVILMVGFCAWRMFTSISKSSSVSLLGLSLAIMSSLLSCSISKRFLSLVLTSFSLENNRLILLNSICWKIKISSTRNIHLKFISQFALLNLTLT